MVVSKEQLAEDKMLNELAAMVKKLTSGMETLNGVQTMGVATMIKEIAQRNGISVSTRRHSADVKKETDLGQETLKVKKELKAEDQYLVRLRHKLNMVQEKEHGAQVRRNINLRHNMDNFNDALNNVKRAIMGGAGFQNAIGTTVKKMAGMTRSYQELEIANKKVKETTQQLQLKTSTVNEFDGKPDSADKKNAEDALKIAQSAHQSAKEGLEAADKNAQGTQGMFKPMFEKLGKLGDFLGKKAIPIGIGVGVAGIFMSIIVKAFSASPLFAAMMKMMKFMVTLILMPIGTFFGALLRPILIMLLRKFIIPMFSTWMPKMMAWGTKAGNFLENPLKYIFDNKDVKTEEELAAIEEAKAAAKAAGVTYDPSNGKDFIQAEDGIDQGWIGFMETFSDWWEKIKNPGGTSEDKIFNAEPIQPGGIIVNGDAHASETDPYDSYLPDDYGQTDFEKNSASNPLYVNDQHTWGGGDGLPEYVNPITPGAGEEATDAQKVINRYINNADIIAQEEHMKNARDPNYVDPLKKALEPIVTYVTNPKYDGTAMEGKLSRITNAGISQEALDKANTAKGHVDKSNYSQATKDLLARAGGVAAANGFDGMVNSPTLFLAGESGSEHVKVTPSGSGGGGGITVNIGTMNGSDNDLRKLKKTILEVIQESSANRGRL